MRFQATKTLPPMTVMTKAHFHVLFMKGCYVTNRFLGEGSDTSYFNEDVVEDGRNQKVIINVANCQKVNLMEIGLESLDGRLDTVIVAKTSNNICGGMKPTN